MSTGTLYRVEQTLGKGMGLFATKDLPKGREVLRESPLVECEKPTPIAIYAQFCELRERSVQSYDNYRRLSNVGDLPPLPPGTKVPDLSHGVGQYEQTRLAAYAASLQQGNGNLRQPFENLRKSVSNRFIAIFENNCFKIRNENDNADAWAVFWHAARLNHSCIPNCYASYSKASRELLVHTIRDIKKNEELTILYDDLVFNLRETRQLRLKNKYGFDCHCPACDKGTPLWLEVETKRKQLANLITLTEQHKAAGSIDTEAFDALQIQMLQLMAEQAGETPKAAKAHRIMAKIHREGKQFKPAESHLKDAERIYLNCLGPASPELEQIRTDQKQIKPPSTGQAQS